MSMPIKNRIKALLGRIHYIAPHRVRFRGTFSNYADAMNAIPKKLTAGYNNENVVDLNFELMCELAPWDYPVLYWLNRLLPENPSLIDVGGHMGTKYRAFRPYLDTPPTPWQIYDLPAIVAAGQARAKAEGLEDLEFTIELNKRLKPEIFLASGVVQYLDTPLPELLAQLGEKPKHLIINKAPLRDGPTLYTLENFYTGLVPYRVANYAGFVAELEQAGYQIQDRWEIPELTHKIATHPEQGMFKNYGFYLVRV